MYPFIHLDREYWEYYNKFLHTDELNFPTKKCRKTWVIRSWSKNLKLSSSVRSTIYQFYHSFKQHLFTFPGREELRNEKNRLETLISQCKWEKDHDARHNMMNHQSSGGGNRNTSSKFHAEMEEIKKIERKLGMVEMCKSFNFIFD